MKREMKDFNKYANRQLNKYYVLKIILYCLAVVLAPAGIVLAIVFHSFWIGVAFWFLCLTCFYSGNYVRFLQSAWTTMLQRCSHCGSTHISAHIDKEQKSFRKFDKFTCEHCKHEWDNSDTLKKIHE